MSSINKRKYEDFAVNLSRVTVECKSPVAGGLTKYMLIIIWYWMGLIISHKKWGFRKKDFWLEYNKRRNISVITNKHDGPPFIVSGIVYLHSNSSNGSILEWIGQNVLELE